MNAAARVIMNHVKPALKQPNWLPVEQGITYTLCVFMHFIHNAQAQQYFSDCAFTVPAASRRYGLMSTGSAVYVLPRTKNRFGERGFFYSGPAIWNTLPSYLHDITDTKLLSVNDSNVYFLTVLTIDYNCWRCWTCRTAAPCKCRVDWSID